MPLVCSRCKNPTKRGIQQKNGDLWCPTCHEDARYGTSAHAVFADGIPGGIVCENYGPNPIRFDSHSERRRYMAAHGLREKETFCPFPGTDRDPQGIPNPKGYMDPKTLENAAVLLTRQRGVDWDGIQAGVLRNITVNTTPGNLRQFLRGDNDSPGTKPVDA